MYSNKYLKYKNKYIHYNNKRGGGLFIDVEGYTKYPNNGVHIYVNSEWHEISESLVQIIYNNHQTYFNKIILDDRSKKKMENPKQSIEIIRDALEKFYIDNDNDMEGYIYSQPTFHFTIKRKRTTSGALLGIYLIIEEIEYPIINYQYINLYDDNKLQLLKNDEIIKLYLKFIYDKDVIDNVKIGENSVLQFNNMIIKIKIDGKNIIIVQQPQKVISQYNIPWYNE